MLDRSNEVLERANKLDDALSNLQAFQSLLEDLNGRTSVDLRPLELPQQQVQAIEMMRAAILRSHRRRGGQRPGVVCTHRVPRVSALGFVCHIAASASCAVTKSAGQPRFMVAAH